MPRCYSCGAFSKNPHRDFDGRAERAYCDLCHAERAWKFEDRISEDSEGGVSIEVPRLSWWQRAKRIFGF